MEIEVFKKTMDQGWLDKLAPFLTSDKFDKIMAALKEEGKDYTIMPDPPLLFRIFKETPYNDLRCIIMGQDPYFTKGVADGIPMSCSRTNILQPSLKMVYEQINNTVYKGSLDSSSYDPNLQYLCKQGVLLINCGMTVREKEPRSHIVIWEPFMEYLFSEVINYYNPGLPIVLLGAEAQKLDKYIAPFTHWVHKVEHPAAASYQNRQWDCKDCFNWINRLLEQNNGSEFRIEWINNLYGNKQETA